NDPLSGQLLKPGERKDDVDVLVRIPVVIIVMGDREPIEGDLSRDDPVAGIPLRVLHVERLLTLQVDPRCSHEGNPALLQRLSERGPRWRPPLSQVPPRKPLLREAGKTAKGQGQDSV